MKKMQVLLTTMILASTLTGCSSVKEFVSGNPTSVPAVQTNKTQKTTQVTEDPIVANANKEVESADKIKELLDITITIPEEDCSYTIIANSIGEVIFTKDEMTYSYRASKDLVGDAMAGIESRLNEEVSTTTINEIECTLGSYENGTSIAYWTSNNMNFSLTCAQIPEEDLKDAISYAMDKTE